MRSIYVETTVVSDLTGTPKPRRDCGCSPRGDPRIVAQTAFRVRELRVVLVREEAAKGDEDQASLRLHALQGFSVLDIDEAAGMLAAKIIDGHGIPEESPEDALHVAVVAVNGMDVLVTWNFTHLNNPFTRMMIRQIVENAGYQCPEFCSPDELLEAAE